MDRRDEIALNLAAVRERIAAACAAAGRDPAGITLIGVTKTYPASDVVHLSALGVTDIGENRDQEAAAKAAEVALTGTQARWHFIGQLQRNKCKSVVTYADLVHSVDSAELAATLADQAARRRGTPLEVLIQVSLDSGPPRGGVAPEEVAALAERVALSPALRLRGLMAVAPLGESPESAFARLARYITLFRADHPDATVVSAGMSGDLDEAIACGATHVRVGSALLGKRVLLR
jgi:pyridoxal phosphate enzyme (YggS family)